MFSSLSNANVNYTIKEKVMLVIKRGSGLILRKLGFLVILPLKKNLIKFKDKKIRKIIKENVVVIVVEVVKRYKKMKMKV